MNNHRCISQKSLITVRKWLLEAGDGPSTSFCIPSSKLNDNIQQKSHLNKIIKQKRHNNPIYHSKTTSIIDWFYEFIREIFTVYDQSQLKSDDGIDDTTTCSTCQFDNVHPNIKTIQSTLKSNQINSILPSKNPPELMITTATSNSNLNIPSQSIVLHSSKSTQTQANQNKQPSRIYPLYCFSVADGQIFPVILSSPSSSFSTNNKKSKYYKFAALPIPSVTSDLHSHFSSHPTIGSITRSDSNTISLQTTQNLIEDDLLSKIHRPSSSFHDTRNCLIECYHPSNFRRCSSSTNTNAPEIVFAESTCHLIKQSWLTSTSDQ